MLGINELDVADFLKDLFNTFIFQDIDKTSAQNKKSPSRFYFSQRQFGDIKTFQDSTLNYNLHVSVCLNNQRMIKNSV